MSSKGHIGILFKAVLTITALSVPMTAIAEDSGYVVGPQDVLTVKVLKEDDFSGDYRVDSKGNLNYPVVGDIPVLGKSVEGVKLTLMGILSKDYLVDPKVSVSVKEYNSKKVMVLGNVARPGVYPLMEKTMILDIITQAGGISSTGSSRLFVLRKEEEGEVEKAKPDDRIKSTELRVSEEPAGPVKPLDDLTKGTDIQEDKMENNTVPQGTLPGKETQDRDMGPIVEAPYAEAGITAGIENAPEIVKADPGKTDEVQAGNKDLSSGDAPNPLVSEPSEATAKEEVNNGTEAGSKPKEDIAKEATKDLSGSTEKTAGDFFSSPRRGSRLKPIVVNYEDILKKGDLTQNIEILGGDIINVPKANEIFVFGSVKNPGPVTYSENMGILQAVSLAGGTLPEASPGSTYVLRMDSGKEKKVKVNFNKVLKQKAKNIELQPNDVVVIPESFF